MVLYMHWQRRIKKPENAEIYKIFTGVMMSGNKRKGPFLLLLTALIWGCAFVAQSAGMDYVGPFTYQATRTLLGALVLVITIKITDSKKKRNGTYEKLPAEEYKRLIKYGMLCGAVLFTASALQQNGIMYTTVGKAGFITALYILFVPIIGIFLKRKMPVKKWICVAVAVVGLFFLCMNERLAFGQGDILVLLCSVAFSAHILIIDRFATEFDGIRLSCVQFITSGVISLIIMIIFEKPQISAISAAWLPIVYGGALSVGVGYTLQILGQKDTPPALASLLMSFESVFAVIFGIILLKQVPTAREIFGCVLMFIAIVAAQMMPDEEEV